MLKIATWNVNSVRSRLDHVIQWLEEVSPDVLALQETKVVDELFPWQAFADCGYRVSFYGQKSYNGVAMVTRKDTETVAPWPLHEEAKRLIAVDYQGVRVINVYIPNGSSLSSDKYTYKLAWLEQLKKYLEDTLVGCQQVVILGDFNIAPQDVDVHDPERWQGILVSPPERQWFKAVQAMGFIDSYRHLSAEPGFTWWDYRQAAYRRNMGLRIDHIMVSSALRQQLVSCDVDPRPRGWDQPSDHAPVVVQIDV